MQRVEQHDARSEGTDDAWWCPQVEEMRRDFEDKLRTFSQAQAQFEADKRRALDELRATHRQEVDELRSSQQNHSATSAEDQEKLAELHRQEVSHEHERPGAGLDVRTHRVFNQTTLAAVVVLLWSSNLFILILSSLNSAFTHKNMFQRPTLKNIN